MSSPLSPLSSLTMTESLKDDYLTEKQQINHTEKVAHAPELHSAAERGHTVTDQYGRVLVEFDRAAEKKLVRKIDLMVVPTVALIYLFCFIDRANIGNARIAGLEKDLQLKGFQYNILLTVFYVSYIVFEIPANILCKIVGPAKWLPFLSLGFGLMSMVTAFCNTFGAMVAVRFLLGVFEAGVLPGIAYYLSRWYRKDELAFRLALYLSTAPLAGAFGGLLASGILKINGIGKVHTWQQLFLVEGIITMGISIIAFFTMTDHPSTARWLSQDEKDLAIARIKAQNVGTTEVTDTFSSKKAMRGIVNPNTLAVAWIFIFVNIAVQGIAFFTPTLIGAIYPTASTIRKQLYTVPPYMVGFVVNLILPFISWKTDSRLPIFIGSACVAIVGYAMLLGSTSQSVRYGAIFLAITGSFPFGCMTNAQVSINILSDSGRSTGIGFNVMLGNIGGLISTWSYTSTDAPYYRIGNGLNTAGNIVILITSIGLYLYLKHDNKRREKIDVDAALAGKSQQEIQDMDWKHPSWRWHT